LLSENRSGGEVEKSIQKQISRLAFGSLSTGHLSAEMTFLSLFNKALGVLKRADVGWGLPHRFLYVRKT
jgi:hypothetical protein